MLCCMQLILQTSRTSKCKELNVLFFVLETLFSVMGQISEVRQRQRGHSGAAVIGCVPEKVGLYLAVVAGVWKEQQMATHMDLMVIDYRS